MQTSESYLMGLDLGQSSDHSALCIVRRTLERDERRGGAPITARGPAYRYDVIHLLRYPLWTSYHAIVDDVCVHCRHIRAHRPLLALDRSGVGAAVAELFQGKDLPADVRPIVITGGVHSRYDDASHSWMVPKVDLVSVLHAVMGENRLRVVPSLDHADLLKKEMLDFRVKISKQAHEIYGSREGQHDDLVLAVSLAVWLGEYEPTGPGLVVGPPVTIPRKLNVLRRRYGTRDSSEDAWNRRGDTRDGSRRYGPSFEGGW